jgi:hypothetical protein
MADETQEVTVTSVSMPDRRHAPPEDRSKNPPPQEVTNTIDRLHMALAAALQAKGLIVSLDARDPRMGYEVATAFRTQGLQYDKHILSVNSLDRATRAKLPWPFNLPNFEMEIVAGGVGFMFDFSQVADEQWRQYGRFGVVGKGTFGIGQSFGLLGRGGVGDLIPLPGTKAELASIKQYKNCNDILTSFRAGREPVRAISTNDTAAVRRPFTSRSTGLMARINAAKQTK